MNTSKEPESRVRVGDWVWVQYQTENDEVDNNLALVVAILLYKNNRANVALLWGKEMRRPNEELVRVVCTDDCWIVSKECIGGRVVESEISGRVVTENSAGEIFSLDRYHILSSSSKRPEVRDSNMHHAVFTNLQQRLESVSFKAWSGRPRKPFLEELHFDKTSPSKKPAQECSENTEVQSHSIHDAYREDGDDNEYDTQQGGQARAGTTDDYYGESTGSPTHRPTTSHHPAITQHTSIQASHTSSAMVRTKQIARKSSPLS